MEERASGQGSAADEVAALKRAAGKDILIQNSTRLTRSGARQVAPFELTAPPCERRREKN